MTNEEANKYVSKHINHINFEDDTVTITVSNEWLDTVGKAVEKQIPKKPKGDFHSVPHYRCPNCNSSVKMFEKDKVFPCCGFCGQAIDWSE